jgi:hypothetical protein
VMTPGYYTQARQKGKVGYGKGKPLLDHPP